MEASEPTDIESAKTVIADLRAENARLQKRILQLEQENDLLSLANVELREGKGGVLGGSTSGDQPPPVPNKPKVGIFGLEEDLSYLDAGENGCPAAQITVVDKVCGGLNPICCRLLKAGTGELLAVCGGVDKFINIYRIDVEQRLAERTGQVSSFTGPLLSVDVNPASQNDQGPELLVTCMDGTHAVVALGDPLNGDIKPPSILFSHKGHEKHAVVGRWSVDGQYFATGGHDKKAMLYDRHGTLLKDFFFSGNVEALTFCHPPREGSESPPTWLIVASRGVPFLTYIDCATHEKKHVSVNAAEWDEHVSFSVLCLAVSPDQRYLLAATDKSRLIIYRLGSNQAVRTLFGHTTDEYSNPRCGWDKTGKFVFCSSQEGDKIVCWSVASERVVESLSGHEGIVRDVAYESSSGILASVGFDKTLRVWGRGA